jgi:hypothetical protein
MYSSLNTYLESNSLYDTTNLNLIFELYYLGFRTSRYKLYLMENFSSSQLMFFFTDYSKVKLGSKYWSKINKQNISLRDNINS